MCRAKWSFCLYLSKRLQSLFSYNTAQIKNQGLIDVNVSENNAAIIVEKGEDKSDHSKPYNTELFFPLKEVEFQFLHPFVCPNIQFKNLHNNILFIITAIKYHINS